MCLRPICAPPPGDRNVKSKIVVFCHPSLVKKERPARLPNRKTWLEPIAKKLSGRLRNRWGLGMLTNQAPDVLAETSGFL